MNDKLTDWNSGDTKPVNVKPGFEVFERDYAEKGKPEDVFYYRFYKGAWMWWSKNISRAATSTIYSWHHNLPWRGLAEKPDGYDD